MLDPSVSQATASGLGRRRSGRDQGHRRATVPRPRLCGQRPRVTSVTGLVHSLGCSSRTIAPAWASPPLQPLAMPAQPTRLVLVGNTTCNGVSLHVSDRAVLTISRDPPLSVTPPFGHLAYPHRFFNHTTSTYHNLANFTSNHFKF
jgi:hypothetical protein